MTFSVCATILGDHFCFNGALSTGASGKKWPSRDQFVFFQLSLRLLLSGWSIGQTRPGNCRNSLFVQNPSTQNTCHRHIRRIACLALTRSISLIRSSPRIKSCKGTSENRLNRPMKSNVELFCWSLGDLFCQKSTKLLVYLMSTCCEVSSRCLTVWQFDPPKRPVNPTFARSLTCLQSASLKLKFPARTLDRISASNASWVFSISKVVSFGSKSLKGPVWDSNIRVSKERRITAKQNVHDRLAVQKRIKTPRQSVECPLHIGAQEQRIKHDGLAPQLHMSVACQPVNVTVVTTWTMIENNWEKDKMTAHSFSNSKFFAIEKYLHFGPQTLWGLRNMFFFQTAGDLFSSTTPWKSTRGRFTTSRRPIRSFFNHRNWSLAPQPEHLGRWSWSFCRRCFSIHLLSLGEWNLPNNCEFNDPND